VVDNLEQIQKGMDLQELEKSRGWDIVKKWLNNQIERNFEKLLKEEDNKYRGKVEAFREVLKYPQIQVNMAKERKRELDIQVKEKK